MKRAVTEKIIFFLDNCIPPAIRDARWFMALAMRLSLGKQYVAWMDLKDKFPSLSEEEINKFYEELANSFVDRPTDLNMRCANEILAEVSRYVQFQKRGVHILDAA